MTLITEMLDTENLDRHVTAGTVARVRHPTEPLTLYNYTQSCQFSGAWDNESRACRGLIVRDDGEIAARPFPKFHNMHEHGDESAAGPIHLEAPMMVFDKLDGSLGIRYERPSDGRTAWATRGSFTSDQAIWATEWWAHNEPRGGLAYDLTNRTLLAEIIYPANRIVVDYRDHEGLTLLAVLDNATGEHIAPLAVGAPWWPSRIVTTHAVTDNIATVDPNDRVGAEGYVVLSGDRRTRVKLKAAEYMRLHKLITGVSNVSVWDLLRNGASLDELREGVPDEFATWLDATIDSLLAEHSRLVNEAEDIFATLKDLRSDRKAFAAEAARYSVRPLLFALLDGKPLTDMVWRQIKPDRETPFDSTADQDSAA